MLSIEALQQANNFRNKEWDPEGKLTLLFWGVELGGECGEACNVIKKLERQKLGLRGSRASVDQLAEELADVVIVAALCADAAHIDLGVAIREKFNATSRKLELNVFL